MTIGYLTNDLVNNYNCSLWEGIEDACLGLGVDFMSFVGGEIDSPYPVQATRNGVYELVRRGAVDGIILNATALFQFISPGRAAEFMSTFAGLPVLTHGARYGDYPAVLVDNAAGIHEVTTHLLRDHGLKHIGFLAGPRKNEESNERLRAYKKALGDFGIVPDSDLIGEGDFMAPIGADAFERMVKTGKKLEALVCANDDMASGAMERARKIGMRVPGELAITGFDDNPYARNLRIPLTTVRQPVLDQGRLAAELLIGWITSGNEPESAILPTRFIIRRSCGCQPHTIFATPPSPSATPRKNASDERRKAVILESTQAILGGEEAAKVLVSLDDRLREECNSDDFDETAWQEALSEVIRTELSGIAEADRVRAESFFHQARVLIQDVAINLLSSTIIFDNQRMFLMRELYVDLTNSFDLPRLFDAMWRRLPLLGVEACLLVLYEGGSSSMKSRLMFGYDGKNRMDIQEAGIPFDARTLIPPEAMADFRRGGFTVEALYFNKERFGYALMRANPRTVVFTALWQQVSASLKGSLLVQELRLKEKALEASLEDQRARGAELEMANKELEAFSYSVSHDLRAPLRAMDGFARILIENHAPKLAPEAVRLLDKIIQNSNQLGKLIDGLLAFAQYNRQELDIRPVSMRKLAEDSLNVFREDIEKYGFKIRLGELMDCRGDPTLLRQVWANLISNAVKFTRGAPGPSIEIDCRETDGERAYYVRDNGVGFDMQYSNKLFGVFQRLHRAEDYEGTGIGLAMAQRIVKRHQGRIWAESAPDRGAAFFFTIK